MRVAVVDIGTNSTRLLIAEVDAGEGVVTELDRRSEVTRLGDGVDASGQLAPKAIERVCATLDAYRAAIGEQAADATAAVLTSAVRDAANGAQFTELVRERYGLHARTIDGDEEAALTFLGAMRERSGDDGLTAVIDIGGGSTEVIVGQQGKVEFNVSVQAGVVRHAERHLHSDPPSPDELQALAAEVRELFADALRRRPHGAVSTAIAVAGTPTSCAAIELELDPYDPARVHGYRLELSSCELLLARLAAMRGSERRHVVGLHPQRAGTIVPGIVMLIELMRALELDSVEVSEHDLLHGVALRLAGGG